MAFEKMTAKVLFEKFQELFPDMIMGNDTDWATVTNYTKIGARMLRMEFNSGPVLYFLWYDENNWNLGTKPYRNRPKKQIYNQVRKDLANGVGMIEAFEKAYQVNNPKNEFGGVPLEEAKGLNEGFRELRTESNEAITSCNQWENIEREAEAMANQPLKPIDWVKEDPEVVMASYPPSAE